MIRRPFVPMRRYELLGGCVWFFLYFFFEGKLLNWINALLSLSWTLAEINFVFYVTNFLLTGILFRRFLAESAPRVFDSPLRFVLIFGICLVCYFALDLTIQLLYSQLVPASPAVPNDDAVDAIGQESRYVMVLGTVVLAPLTEELLFRGLLFGNARRRSRPAAYLVTALAFTLLHIRKFLSGMAVSDIVFDTLLYSLGSVVLSADYELTNTIWGPVLLHMGINGVLMISW